MVIFVTLGTKFSGGSIVLDEVMSLLQSLDENMSLKLACPNLHKGKIYSRIQQIYFLIMWPVILRHHSNHLICVTHSLLCLSPLTKILKKTQTLVFIQGEEYKALKSKFLRVALDAIAKISFRRFTFICTNKYLEHEVMKKRGAIIEIKSSLGPKRFYFNSKNEQAKKSYIAFVAREGFNKAAEDAVKVAQMVQPYVEVRFIAPDNKLTDWIRGQGLDCTTSIDPTSVRKFFRSASAFFLPSHYEGLSLPMLESLATGTPVATFSDGFPKFFSIVSSHVTFIPNRDTKRAADWLIKSAQRQSKVEHKSHMLCPEIYNFEKHCQEVALEIYNRVKSLEQV